MKQNILKKSISVDILVPCYNESTKVLKCLNSLIDQDYKNLNIIILVDGSTNDTYDIVLNFVKQHPNSNIKLFWQENQGLAKARNVLLNLAKSDYIFFVDADDWIESNCISKFIEKINDDEDVIVGTCYLETSKKIKPYYITNKKAIDKNDLLIKNALFAWNNLIKTKFIRENNLFFYDQYKYFEDAGLMSYLIYKSNKINFVHQPFYHYVVNKNSLSRSKINKYKIESSIAQIQNLYSLIRKENFKTLPKGLNDQLAFYHSIIYSYIFINFFKLSFKNRIDFKKLLKNFEKSNFKLSFPKCYWKWWFFLFYRIFCH